MLTTLGCCMEMPTRDSRSVSTLRAMLALCTITFTATAAPFHEPASSSSIAQHSQSALYNTCRPLDTIQTTAVSAAACSVLVVKPCPRGCHGWGGEKYVQICMPSYASQGNICTLHRPWRTFVDPAKGSGAYQIAKFEVRKVGLMRAAAPRPGR